MEETPEVKEKMAAVLSQLDELEAQYQAWMSDQVLPRPSATTTTPTRRTTITIRPWTTADEDHLELQKAIRAELDKLVATLNGLHL